MKDLQGKQFDKLKVIGSIHKQSGNQNRLFWKCQCECGKETIATSHQLIHKRRKSCGCGRKKNLINQRFGKLVVISFDHTKLNAAYWKCKCDCGNECITRGSTLRRGKTQSCGCISKIIGNQNPRFKGYGEISGAVFGKIKRGARERRRDTSRSIKFNLSIQDLWNLFLKQKRKCALSGAEINFPPCKLSGGTASLDRIDSSGDYVIDNVQWVHKDINLMKQTLKQSSFVEWCKKVASYQNMSIKCDKSVPTTGSDVPKITTAF